MNPIWNQSRPPLGDQSEKKDRLTAFFNASAEAVKFQALTLPASLLGGHEVLLARDDRLHPMIAGNKWWKLKHVLIESAARGVHSIKSFGGAYSNHLLALAGAGYLFGFRTIGVLRGQEPRALNPVLRQASAWGMEFEPVSRIRYRELTQGEHAIKEPAMDDGCLILPEGGAGPLALKGIKEMVGRIQAPYQLLCTPVGTGTTLTGMILGAASDSSVMGFSALKGAQFIEKKVGDLLAEAQTPHARWQMAHAYHFGGYARRSQELDAFCSHLSCQLGNSIDWVYTGKMLYGLNDLMLRQALPEGRTVVAWMTGNACQPGGSLAVGDY